MPGNGARERKVEGGASRPRPHSSLHQLSRELDREISIFTFLVGSALFLRIHGLSGSNLAPGKRRENASAMLARRTNARLATFVVSLLKKFRGDQGQPTGKSRIKYGKNHRRVCVYAVCFRKPTV